MPEAPAGRPFIPRYFEAAYDTVPASENYRLCWIEFPDYDAEMNAYRDIAHSGIGIGLNASGVYSAYYCSQTQELTEQRSRKTFFRPGTCMSSLPAPRRPPRLTMRKACSKK